MLKITRRQDGIYRKIETQASFEQALLSEIAERQAAVASLQSQLEAEAAARQAADQALVQRIAEISGGSVPPDLEVTIQEISAGLADLRTKTFLIPVEEITNDGTPQANPVAVVTDFYRLHYNGPGQIFPGKVDVLTHSGDEPLIGPDGKEVTAQVDSNGNVTFSRPPNAVVRLTYGVLMPFSDLPQEFLKVKFKSGLEKDIGMLLDVQGLKKDMAIEHITPTGLYTQAIGGTVYLTFTYQDRPELSHFILERYNPATGEWEPYDGDRGIVTKQ